MRTETVCEGTREVWARLSVDLGILLLRVHEICYVSVRIRVKHEMAMQREA